jgi:hypothetical protein
MSSNVAPHPGLAFTRGLSGIPVHLKSPTVNGKRSDDLGFLGRLARCHSIGFHDPIGTLTTIGFLFIFGALPNSGFLLAVARLAIVVF